MKKYHLPLYVLLLSALLTTLNAVAQSPAHMPRISVQGNRFVSENGDPLVFRGVSSSDPDKLEREGHWDKAYFEEIKKWGANVVRFPIHPDAWRRRGQTAYMQLLDRGVQWAKELGLYVIIDWHSIGNLRSELFQAPTYETTQKETFEFWRTMAKHFKNEPAVAFFELFNEPTVYNGQLGNCTWAQWKAIMEETITIIRAHDCPAIPLVAGFDWAYDLTPVAAEPIDAKGIAYVSHPYPQKRNAPWPAQWTADWGFVAEKYPVILTEIGFCGPEDPGAHIPVISDESYGDAITAYTAEKGISWVAWVFDPQWAPNMFTDWNFTPSRQGVYFKKVLIGYNQPEKPLYTFPLGVQAYTFRNHFPKNVTVTLDSIKAMGFTELEGGAPKGMTPEDFRKLCDARGIKIPSTGAEFNELDKSLEQVVRRAKILGANFVMCAWIPHQNGNFSIEDAKKAVEVFNRAGKVLKENGLTFCYHNHGYEFQPAREGTLFDYLVQNTNPEYVSFEMDLLWTMHGGADPVELLNKYPGRWKLMHLKDLKKGVKGDLTGHTPAENDVVLGTGQADMRQVLKAAAKAGIRHYFIEDESEREMKNVPASVAFLKGLR